MGDWLPYFGIFSNGVLLLVWVGKKFDHHRRLRKMLDVSDGASWWVDARNVLKATPFAFLVAPVRGTLFLVREAATAFFWAALAMTVSLFATTLALGHHFGPKEAVTNLFQFTQGWLRRSGEGLHPFDHEPLHLLAASFASFFAASVLKAAAEFAIAIWYFLVCSMVPDQATRALAGAGTWPVRLVLGLPINLRISQTTPTASAPGRVA